MPSKTDRFPWLPLAALLLTLSLSGCVRLTLAWAPDKPRGPEAEPAITTESVAAWEARKPEIRETLEAEIYGRMPDDAKVELISHKVIDKEAFDGIGVYEEFDVRVTPVFDADPASPASPLMIAVLSPQGEGPFPVIMTETFCPSWAALPHPQAHAPEDRESGEAPGIITYVFGRYICTPPLEMIIQAGFAIAVVNSTQVVPDSSDAGLATLDRLAPGMVASDDQWGAIGAWGWVFSRMVDVLGAEERFDEERLIAYGHSRYGKAALVAGAFDERIAGVIAHQSGTGGASLNRQKVGESVGSITKSYPHWFAPRYASFAGKEEQLTYDQHHLIALVAPRPVLLGNARRDVWSDPNGGFKAAQGAEPVYALYEAGPITLDRLDGFQPSQPLSFWMRPGTHGVVEEDWPAFLEFLEAHF